MHVCGNSLTTASHSADSVTQSVYNRLPAIVDRPTVNNRPSAKCLVVVCEVDERPARSGNMDIADERFMFNTLRTLTAAGRTPRDASLAIQSANSSQTGTNIDVL